MSHPERGLSPDEMGLPEESNPDKEKNILEKIRAIFREREKNKRLAALNKILKDYPYYADVEGVAAKLIEEGNLTLEDLGDDPEFRKAVERHLESLEKKES